LLIHNAKSPCGPIVGVIAINHMEDNAKHEILEAISEFADQVDRRFERIESDIGSLKSEVGNLKSEIGTIKATMVTKSYLDDKLADLKGDMVSMLRKEDQKANRLIGIMAEKRLLTPAETQDVLSFRPFP